MPRSENGQPADVGLYARISLDRSDGEGVARQLDDCRSLAAERWPGARVVEYVDNDISAFRAKRRPEFLRLVDDLAAGRVGAVVAYHPDRIYRQLTDLETFVKAVRAAGAQVATVKAGDVDVSTASGQMVAEILASVSKHEAARIGERVARAKQERAAQGRHSGGGLRAYGLTADRTDLVAAEAQVLREAAAAILGGASWTSTVDRLNAEGARSTAGRQWTIGSIRRVLTSPHVAGLRSYRGAIVGPATWPAVIERGDWERLRTKAAARKRGRPPSDRHLLTGLVWCGRCDPPRAMWANGSNDRFAYRCPPAMMTTGRGCGLSIAADPLERLVAEMIFVAIDEGTLAERIAARRRTHKAAPDLERIEAELDALADDLGNERISRREWLRAREPLVRRRDEAQAARAAAEAAVDSGLDELRPGLREHWPGYSIERQRRIVAAVFERLTILPAARRGMPPLIEGIGHIDPDRIDPTWRA